jgi:uncharacterized repeat protein (TIGR03803 family)
MTELRGFELFAPPDTASRETCLTAYASLLKAACALFLLCAIVAIAAPGQTFNTMFTFDNTNGEGPQGPLVQGPDGNYYGVTVYGGVNNCTGGPCGTVFKITPEGTLTTIYNFCSLTDCADGYNPVGALVLGIDGNFYGVTANFGNIPSEVLCSKNCGTVFKITPGGTLTTLHSFVGSDGEEPLAGLVQGGDEFYGTTALGGAGSHACNDNTIACGTIFRITPRGTLTTLYDFCSQTNCTDGKFPLAPLIQASDGNFYGTTNSGGATNSNCTGCGTVFKITPRGTLTTLYDFCSQTNCADGAFPETRLIQVSDGQFYGATNGTGIVNSGTVFKMTPGGKLTTLYSFPATGSGQLISLAQVTDGNFYGTALANGSDFYGTFFQITPTGTPTTLHTFTGGTDGISPDSVFQATNGSLYGTTGGGVPCDECTPLYGTVFSEDMGLGPFVTFVQNSGKVGQSAQILGQGFTGTSGVSFNGTPARFTVQSDTYLTAKIPAGVASGIVTVTTPSGKLSSNVTFRVIPQILNFSPPSGPVGTNVVITGNSFTGATIVGFGGVAATSFTVVSDTQITATVPAGAQTGNITVHTAGGTVASVTLFTVTP